MKAVIRSGVVALGALAGGAAAAPLPLEDLVRNPQFSAARISPTGDYFALTAERGDQDVLVVMRRDDLKIINVNQLPNDKSVGAFYWAGPRRLMFTATVKLGFFAVPLSTGEWYAVDADGKDPRTLISYDTKGATERGKQVSTSERFSMLDPLRNEDGRVLMQVGRAGSADGQRAEVVEVDTKSGRRKLLLRGPAPNCYFATDAGHEVRYASCTDKNDERQLYRRRGGLADWEVINDSVGSGLKLAVYTVTPDGRVLAEQDNGKQPSALGWLNPEDGRFTEVFRDELVDPRNVLNALDGETPIGVITMPDKVRVHLIDEEHPDVATYVSLAEAFPGQFVSIASATADKRRAVILVSSDTNPGEYYLLDRESGKVRFLMKRRPWIDPAKMAKMEPIAVEARDGMVLHGYLTAPVGRERKNLPMIVYVHGGPHGPRDEWGYDEGAQILASRGYLVLQINFRGSGGYGKAFEEAGHREWGGKMQDDVTDATGWAVERGYADPERICIYGGSYGGYAALMGAAKEPDLYKCAAGYVGVYDLAMLYTTGDVPTRESGRIYLRKVIGTDAADHKARSPAQQAGRIGVPVFLAAGLKDGRAVPEHTRVMFEALKKAGNPVREEDYILQSGEGHGFYDEKNKHNYYSRLLAFFSRHIGGTVEIGGAAATTSD